jgi:hypothetical protein
MLAMSSLGWADSCSTLSLASNGQTINCTIPEASPEVALSVTLTALTFTAQAQGMVLIYDDSTHTLLSTEMQRRRRKPELLWRKRFYWAVNR